MARKCIVVVVLDICNAEGLLGDLPEIENDSTGLIVFTACRVGEEARNLVFSSGDSAGILTYNLLKMIATNKSISYNELFIKTEASVNETCNKMVEKGVEKARQHVGMKFTNASLVDRKFLEDEEGLLEEKNDKGAYSEVETNESNSTTTDEEDDTYTDDEDTDTSDQEEVAVIDSLFRKAQLYWKFPGILDRAQEIKGAEEDILVGRVYEHKKTKEKVKSARADCQH
ncbi:hypothetical protein L195_g042990, partial [Trifolium pratense]